jgi:hypothetical protein
MKTGILRIIPEKDYRIAKISNLFAIAGDNNHYLSPGRILPEMF